MALSPQVVHLVIDCINQLKTNSKNKLKVASLGYPDILLSLATLEDNYGLKGLASRPDWKEVSKFHGRGELKIPSAESFFDSLGVELDVLDIKQWRGGEIIVDLNCPIKDKTLLNKYDLVINNGTTEHCFNVVQAMINIWKMVKVGGCVLDWGPAWMPNHGFWSFNPTLYYDFYGANGGQVLTQSLWNFESRDEKTVEVPYEINPVKRFNFSSYNCSLLTLSKKTAKLNKIVYPVQTKYKSMGL